MHIKEIMRLWHDPQDSNPPIKLLYRALAPVLIQHFPFKMNSKSNASVEACFFP